MKDGSIYSSEGVKLENPSILIDGDVVLRIGDFSLVNKYFEMLYKTFSSVGLNTSSITLISFSEFLSEEFTINDVCYILRRCFEYSSSGYVEKLRVLFGTDEFLEWFNCEKVKVPL